MPGIERITVHGFKSIREMSLELRALNVLIGANGSGKSNFIGVFSFLNELVNENLQLYVGRSGGSDLFLYFGQKTTPQLHLRVDFTPSDGHRANAYVCTLVPTVGNGFVFAEEMAYFHDRQQFAMPDATSLGVGHVESKLTSEPAAAAHFVTRAMKSWRIYHFHDTSETARVKQLGDLNDNEFLRPDAANLAAFLFMLEQTQPGHYRNIVGAVRLIAPFFDQFSLRPSPLNPDKIRLEWREKGSDLYFNTHSLSDGTLRFICLATLLLQPPAHLPDTILLDEPELGLHPYAITVLAHLLRSASQHTQVLVSTQSVTLVNQFAPEDVVIVDRADQTSRFRRLEQDQIEHWLEDYRLGDLWEKNVIGGRPKA